MHLCGSTDAALYLLGCTSEAPRMQLYTSTDAPLWLRSIAKIDTNIY